MGKLKDQAIHDFTNYLPVNGEVIVRFEELRDRALDFVDYLERLVPEGRERSLAYTHVEQALMYARAAIARSNQDRLP